MLSELKDDAGNMVASKSIGIFEQIVLAQSLRWRSSGMKRSRTVGASKTSGSGVMVCAILSAKSSASCCYLKGFEQAKPDCLMEKI